MADLRAIEPEPLATNVIQKLEQALIEARAGQLSSVAIASVYRDGTAGHAWSELPSRVAMLGSITRLAHLINLDADE